MIASYGIPSAEEFIRGITYFLGTIALVVIAVVAILFAIIYWWVKHRR